MADKTQLGWMALRERLDYGARANKYLVNITLPGGSGSGEISQAGSNRIDFKNGNMIYALCKGASIPERSVGVCDVWIQGRKIPIAGDAEYNNTWTLTFYNDQNHDLRKQFEIWIENIDSYNEHKRGFTAQKYYADKFVVSQLDAKDQTKPCASWDFFHVFPTSISAVEFGADTNNQVSEFTCTFTYSKYDRITPRER